MTKQFLVPIVLPADPTAALEAATKQYVDALTAAGNEVFIGTADPRPGNPGIELWYDSDDDTPVVGEVYIGPDDPITTAPTAELWFDTDDTTAGPAGTLKARVSGAWVTAGGGGASGEEVPFAGPEAPPAPDDGELWWDTDDTSVPGFSSSTDIDGGTPASTATPVVDGGTP